MVIIKKLNKIKRILKSLRFQSIILIFLIGFIPVLVAEHVIISQYKDSIVDERTKKVQNMCTLIANEININGNLSAKSISDVVPVIAGLTVDYDCRVEIVDSDFKIIYDSYNRDAGKITVYNAVARAYDGADVVEFLDDQDIIQIAMKITDGSDVYGAVLVNVSVGDINDNVHVLRERANIVLLVISITVAAIAVLTGWYVKCPFKKIEKNIKKLEDNEEINRNLTYTELQDIQDAFIVVISRMKQLDESRQEFVSNVSHELKTPITSIKVLADSLVSMDEVPNEMYREFMTDIVDEIDRENQIINDLLTLVRMDKKVQDIKISEVSMNELVEKVIKRVKPIAAKRNIEIEYESFKPVIAEVDQVKMNMIVTNLVENAVKYNVLDGWVRVSLNADHNYFYLKISDSGVGIPEDCQQKVFERFYRVDKARSRETGGTGLGLAITSSAVKMHKGEIKLYSKEGEGTTFTVRIPLHYVP